MSDFVVGIHRGSDYSFSEFLQRFKIILRFNKINTKKLYIGDLDFWHELSVVKYFISRFIQLDSDVQLGKTILPVIETVLNIKCLPNISTFWHYDDKVRQYYLLKESNSHVVPTFIFWNEENAMDWAQKAAYPIVFKLKKGAGSSNVILVKKKKAACNLVKRMFSKKGISSQHIPHISSLSYWRNFLGIYRLRQHIAKMRGRIPSEHIYRYWQANRGYVLFQEFLADNEYDTRVTVIGNRAFAFRRFVRPNDFRASGSGRIDYDPRKIDLRCLDIAFTVSNNLGFQTMAYDFIFDQRNEPKISEISYTYVDTAVQRCPGYWDNDLKWCAGHYWPQYCQLQDLINEVDLVQPKDSIMLKIVRA